MVYYLSRMTPRPDHLMTPAFRGGRPHHFRHGPARFTLPISAAKSASRPLSGASARSGLMLACALAHGVDALDAVRAHTRHRSRDAGGRDGDDAIRESPEEMSNHLAFLQTDLSDPDFYAVM